MLRRHLVFLLLVFGGGAGGLLVFLHRAPLRPSALLLGRRRGGDAERVCAPARLAMLLVQETRDAQQRQLIRDTWAHPLHVRHLGLSVAFGVSPADVDGSIDFEAEMFGDLLHLGDDGPLEFLQAAREACRRPYFVGLVEPEFFVNTFALVDALSELQKQSQRLHHRNAIWCRVWEGDAIISSTNESGWSLVTTTTLSNRHCLPGPLLMTSRTADALLLTQQLSNVSRTFVDLEFVTGPLSRNAGVGLVQKAEWFQQTMDEKRVLDGRTIFTRIGRDWDESRVEGLWKKLVDMREDGGL